MRRVGLLCTSLVGASFALVASTPALGAGWTHITAQTNGAKPNLGLARTSNGTLHVLWRGPGRAPYTAVMDTAISPTGSVGQAQTVVSSWDAVSELDAAVLPDGSVHAIVSGGEKVGINEPHDGLNELTGPGNWVLGAHAFGNS